MHRRYGAIAVLLLGIVTSTATAAEEYYDRYDLAPRSNGFDIGLQPLAYPLAMIGAVLRRDRILKQQLARRGQPFTAHPFRRGPDLVRFFGKERLEGGLLGDMPTISAAMREEIVIVGLAKSTTSAIVSREDGLLERLAGKRIGYIEGSSAHHTLLQGLNSVGLTEARVTLLPVAIDDMADALEKGSIDAFAAWEPTPSIALARNSAHRIVFRGRSSSYFVLDREFARKHPEAAHQVIAAYVRALQWMRRSGSNAERAARWAMADGQAFTGKPPQLTVAQAVAIAHREILDIPSAPAIAPGNGTEPPLAGEFHFLKRLGKIPADSDWERIRQALDYTGLREVLQNKARYRIDTFDYEN